MAHRTGPGAPAHRLGLLFHLRFAVPELAVTTAADGDGPRRPVAG
ncbi:hypothetical protein [Kitasatospora sp. NPDC057198]